MACNDCSPNIKITYDSPYNQKDCGCDEPGIPSNDSSKVIYNGPKLTCTDVETGTDLETLFQQFDEKICANTGDYSTYDVKCLAPISTEKEFVEAISSSYCDLQSDYDDFVNNTYENDKTVINTKIDENNIPNITSDCTDYFNPISTDTNAEVLQKVSNAICQIHSSTLDMSTVDWDNCFTVTTVPTSVQEGFGVVLSQICQLKTEIGDLSPSQITFDNSGTCLTGGTSEDTLSTTIGLIKTRLCATPKFDIDALNWNCVTKPTTNENTDLQKAFQAVLTSLDGIKQRIPIFSTDFTTVTSGCDGINVSLGTTVTDNKVASNSADTNPGTLEDKLYAGDNISIDYATIPGKAIITASGSGGTASDGKVKAFASDPTPGYLSSKIEGSSNGDVQITVSENVSDGKVTLNGSLDGRAVLETVLNTLNDLPTSDPLFQLFCELKNRCPESCATVTDVTVNYYPTSSTTTTTTTIV